ncbi:DUF4352 domain-containing protein [Nocardia sp. NPDC060259]|uniref:DUF4352 domain-containing protein n=1 Tax=Nocardia sp. NPDC060259 TaxID=3347088 RepID=UPI003653A12A
MTNPPGYPSQPPYNLPRPYPPGFRPPPKNNNALILWIAGSCVGVCLLGIFAIGADTSDSSNRSSATTSRSVHGAGVPTGTPAPTTVAPKPAKNQPAPAGTAVRDDKFEFLVTGIDQGDTVLGGGFWSERATGEFVVVRVQVTNIGNEARTFYGTNQYLYDEHNRKFDSSFGANAALSDDFGSIELNPGLSVATAIVFDVPPGTVPAVLQFHDSMFSGGVKVRAG